MQINLANNGLNMVQVGLIYIYIGGPICVFLNRHTFICRKFSGKVSGKVLTMLFLGSEDGELSGKGKRILIFLLHHILFDSLKNQYMHFESNWFFQGFYY